MNCEKCGKNIPEQINYCPSCKATESFNRVKQKEAVPSTGKQEMFSGKKAVTATNGNQEIFNGKKVVTDTNGKKYVSSYSITSVVNRLSLFLLSGIPFYVIVIIGTSLGNIVPPPTFLLSILDILMYFVMGLPLIAFIRIFLPERIELEQLEKKIARTTNDYDKKTYHTSSIVAIISIFLFIIASGALYGLIFSILILLNLDSLLIYSSIITILIGIFIAFIIKKYGWANKKILKFGIIITLIDIILFIIKLIIQSTY